MTVLTVFLVVLGALLAACVVVLYRRRGNTGSMDPHVRSAARTRRRGKVREREGQ